MIIFKTVRWKNLLSTGNIFTEVDLLNSPSTLIVGENGAGKSTFIEAISYALYGKPFRKINKPQLINSINQKQLLVELEFSISNKQYLIRRGMKPSVFEIFQDETLINQDAALRDYQEYLEKTILKLNHKSFTQIITLGSRSFVPFMQLPTGQRREIIEDLLDLQIFSIMNNLLKQKVTDNKDNIKSIKYQADLCQEKIRLQREYIKTIQANNDKQIEAHKQKIVELDQNIKDETLNIHDLQNEITKLSSQNNKVELIDKMNDHMSLHNNFTNKISVTTKDIEFYHNHDNCPTCKQSIEQEFKCETINIKTKQNQSYEQAIKNINESYSKLVEELKYINEIEDKISNLNTDITRLNAKISSSLDFKIKIEKEIKRLSEEYKTNTGDQEKLEQLKTEFKGYVDKHETLINQKSIIDVVSVLLKDGGIKSKIIKQYIPIMNKLINKYLAAMELNVSFELDENFNETVRSRHRDEFSYDSFSEGEKTRIDLAILFAWRSIAKLRNANSSNLLVLDETFDGSLDSTGMDELLKIIMTVANESNVFVISHKDQMMDKFSNVIRFEKVKNFSKIKDAA